MPDQYRQPSAFVTDFLLGGRWNKRLERQAIGQQRKSSEEVPDRDRCKAAEVSHLERPQRVGCCRSNSGTFLSIPANRAPARRELNGARRLACVAHSHNRLAAGAKSPSKRGHACPRVQLAQHVRPLLV